MNSRLIYRELRVEITGVDRPQDTTINDRYAKSCTRGTRMNNNASSLFGLLAIHESEFK
jgi:hypothetical protein